MQRTGYSETLSPNENRETVLRFYRRCLIEKRPQQAFAEFMSPDFVEHKPDVAVPNRAGTADFLHQLMVALPEATWDIVRTIAEGDMVCVHARFTPTPGAPPYVIADFFRLHAGQIVEHWDVVAQPVAAPKNPNPRL